MTARVLGLTPRRNPSSLRPSTRRILLAPAGNQPRRGFALGDRPLVTEE